MRKEKKNLIVETVVLLSEPHSPLAHTLLLANVHCIESGLRTLVFASSSILGLH